MKKIKLIPLAILFAINALIVVMTFVPTQVEALGSTCYAFDWTVQHHENHPACNPGTTACTDMMSDWSTCTHHMWVGIPILQIYPPN